MMWNGPIEFYSQNYQVISLSAYVGLKHYRFGSDRLKQENFNAIVTIVQSIFVMAYPFVMMAIYSWKIKSNIVKPDLTDKMTKDELK